jgi:cobalt/nickel transport system permease protein
MATKVIFLKEFREYSFVAFYLYEKVILSAIDKGVLVMHMADALISPAVGGTLWALSTGLASYSATKVKKNLDESKIPLMGVMGAFIFAAQMINFTIPATGSSGHLGGGMILAILLGSYAGFLTMASILTVQALFFADGGLLALGCNIFNMGFFPCFIAYPFIYKPLAGKNPIPGRLFAGISLAAIIGLQLGAFSVVLETMASGISELPFWAFALLMQPIHLLIGIVEGLVCTAVILFIFKERPELITGAPIALPIQKKIMEPILIGLFFVTLITGSFLSSFASQNPDGLEWSIAKITNQEGLKAPADVRTLLADMQKKTAFLPDYNFKEPSESTVVNDTNNKTPSWPYVNGGTSLSGIVGSFLTLLLAVIIAKGIKLVFKHP